ncbi:PP2C family protein-serine/threonine phosphatase [Pantoea anthophila]|uniref:PPM-type phosphatase domain-containing protein n=1 Tax=Pantoea anthophila TaxID=470931 RepID=A0ABY2Z4Y3_9GAMM|nr:hypothetical protein [Pantoea anthophila]TPV23651.1 hypothetical protein FJW00_14950 [Pantoea anthophila]
MLIPEHHVSWQGDRAEQLDRFQVVETGKCTLLMMADGFSDCDASPHYVDWLVGELEKLNVSGQGAGAVCLEIGALLRAKSDFPGKASVAFVVSDDWEYRYATLGDTRIYWPSGRERTRDDSLAERCVMQGLCPPDSLRHHPLRNTLTAYAGGIKKMPVSVTWHTRPHQQAERLLVCTDGFWSRVCDDDIYAISSGSAFLALIKKMQVTEESGKADNLTAALLCYAERSGS